MMSFASDARGEVVRQVCDQPCCARAEVAAALLFCGGIAYHGRDRYSLCIVSPDAFVVRHYFVLIKNFFHAAGEIRTLRTTQLRAQTRYQLLFDFDDSLAILRACGLLSDAALFGVRTTPPRSPLRLLPQGVFARRIPARRRGEQSGKELSLRNRLAQW